MPYLTDGYKTLLVFNVAPFLAFQEREVQPPDMDGGGEVDTTTMLNNVFRTKQPKKLITLGNAKVHCQWNPILYATIIAVAINKNDTISIFFPDNSKIVFWGWLNKATPASLKEGEFPLMELDIHCSNQDTFGIERGPLYFPPP